MGIVRWLKFCLSNAQDKRCEFSGSSVINLALANLERVRLFTAVGCLALSVFAFLNIDIVGRDGVLYLQTARVFAEQGFLEAFNIYSWPFYSILIGLIHKLTGLSIEYSGYLLNTVLLLVLTDAFVRLYAEVNPQSQKLWMAAIAVLAFAGMNDYRIDIIRGWGFMAFSLTAFFYFVRFSKTESVVDAVLWQVFILLAVLFRVEAVVYMFLVPIWLVTFAENKSFKRYWMANSIFISTGVILMVFVGSVSIVREKINMYLTRGGNPLENFSSHVAVFAEEVLNRFSEDYAFTILASGIAIMVMIKIVTKLGLFYAAVTAGGIMKRGFPKHGQFGLVVFLLTISYVIVLMFFSQTLIMTGRYVLLSSLLLLILGIFYLEEWFQYLASKKQKRWMYAGFVLPMTIMLISGLVHTSGNNKKYIKEAGIWAKNNLPKEAALLTNDRRLQYYSGLEQSLEIFRFQETGSTFMKEVFERYDYLLLRDKKGKEPFQPFVADGRLHIEKEISNEKGARAVLYRINKQKG